MPGPLHARRAAAAAGHRISLIQCRIFRRGRDSPLHAAEQPLDRLRMQHAIDGPERGCGARRAHGRRACALGWTHKPMLARGGRADGHVWRARRPAGPAPAGRRCVCRCALGGAALWSVLGARGYAAPRAWRGPSTWRVGLATTRRKARCVRCATAESVCCLLFRPSCSHGRSCTRLHLPSTRKGYDVTTGAQTFGRTGGRDAPPASRCGTKHIRCSAMCAAQCVYNLRTQTPPPHSNVR